MLQLYGSLEHAAEDCLLHHSRLLYCPAQIPRMRGPVCANLMKGFCAFQVLYEEITERPMQVSA